MSAMVHFCVWMILGFVGFVSYFAFAVFVGKFIDAGQPETEDTNV